MNSDFSCELSVVKQSDGSAKFSHKNTSVMASIYGPNEIKQSKEMFTDMHIEVNFKPKISSQIQEKLRLEEYLTNICTASILVKEFSKNSLTVVVQELDNDGSMLACLVNAISAALLESAMPQKNAFAAVNVAIDVDDNIIINPTLEQELSLTSITFVLNKNHDIIFSLASKITSQAIFEKCFKSAIDYASNIFDIYKKKIAELL